MIVYPYISYKAKQVFHLCILKLIMHLLILIVLNITLNPKCILIKSNSVVATHLVLAYSWLSTFSPGSRNKQKCWQSRQFLQTCTKLHSLCHIPCQFVAMVLALLCTLYTRASVIFDDMSQTHGQLSIGP